MERQKLANASVKVWAGLARWSLLHEPSLHRHTTPVLSMSSAYTSSSMVPCSSTTVTLHRTAKQSPFRNLDPPPTRALVPMNLGKPQDLPGWKGETCKRFRCRHQSGSSGHWSTSSNSTSAWTAALVPGSARDRYSETKPASSLCAPSR